MWEFRRRPEDQTPEQRAALEALFDELPELGFLHHFRWELTAIFDQAPDRETAERGIEEMREIAAGSDLDLTWPVSTVARRLTSSRRAVLLAGTNPGMGIMAPHLGHLMAALEGLPFSMYFLLWAPIFCMPAWCWV